MNVLQINGQKEHILSFSNVTLLCGTDERWYEVVSNIKDFFRSKSSKIQIRLNDVGINKKDWETFFLTMADGLSFDERVTLKSPVYLQLLSLLKDNIETQEYRLLVECWEELSNSLAEKFQEKMNRLSLPLKLNCEELQASILAPMLNIVSERPMSMFEQRLTLLKWFLAEKQEKNRLVVFEYPEIYTSQSQLDMLEELMGSYAESSVYFIIVSSHDFKIPLARNILVNNNLINQYTLSLLYNLTEEDMPFVFDEKEYNMAVTTILNHWHRNSRICENINSLPIKSAYIVAFLYTKLGMKLDFARIDSDEIKKFINNN